MNCWEIFFFKDNSPKHCMEIGQSSVYCGTFVPLFRLYTQRYDNCGEIDKIAGSSALDIQLNRTEYNLQISAQVNFLKIKSSYQVT